MGRKVSMQQIADITGVSKFAVSRALAGKSGVKPETRHKIIQAATQLGYFVQKGTKAAKVNQILDSASQPAKEIIAVLIPNLRSQNKENPYWGKVIDGITNGLDQQGLGMIIITDSSAENFMRVINPQGLLGFICVGLVPTPMLMDIRQSGVPFVFIDHEDPLLPSDTIFMNNYDCVRRLTNHMVGLGHRSFQFVGDITVATSYYDRWKGFSSILEEHNIPLNQDPELLKVYENDSLLVVPMVKKLLEIKLANNTMPTALVCANDTIALGVLNALKELGVSVPNDCSVSGFDDIIDTTPSLTTVHGMKEILGRRAVEILLWRLNHRDDPLEKTLLYGDVIIRESTVPPSRR